MVPSKRGQMGIFGFIILMGLFVVVYLVGLAPTMGQQCDVAIAGGLSGIEAFLFCNMNLLVMIIALLAVAGFALFGGGQ